MAHASLTEEGVRLPAASLKHVLFRSAVLTMSEVYFFLEMSFSFIFFPVVIAKILH
jgi:hypothetical protein